MTPGDFAAAMRRILAQAGKPARIVSALSGGLDSVTLLRLLLEWRKAENAGVPVIAAHLNHGLRGDESERDLDFSRELARTLGVDFAEKTVNIARIAKMEGMGLEEAGRMTRYRLFHEVGGDNALTLTGHHADDQAETILLNLRRGAHRRGLSGMRETSWVPVPPGIRIRTGRPLLTVPRETLRAMAESRGWQWREDASNASLLHSRNRIRHRVIPMLEKIMPGFRDHLLAAAAARAGVEEEMTRRGGELAESATRREGGGRFFRIDDRTTAEEERLLYAFRHVVEEELGARLPYGAVLSRLAELAERGRPGETLTLPANLRVRREADGLFFFFPDNVAGDAYSEVILPDPPFSIRAYGLEIDAAWVDYAGTIPAADRASPDVQWLDAAALRWPLCLRPPREGERFRPLGAPGSRKIQDMLVDAKMPRRLRAFPRVVADYGEAVWLWPVRLAHRARLGGTPCRALRLSLSDGG